MKIDRQQVYDKCDGHCAYCGVEITLKQMQVDHIQPHWHTFTEQDKFKHSKRLLKDENAINKQLKIARAHGSSDDKNVKKVY